MTRHDLVSGPEGKRPSDFAELQRRWWEREFQGGFGYSLSNELTDYIVAYVEKHSIDGSIIELACGLNPSSDSIKNISDMNRLLVDIVDLGEYYSAREESGLCFLQHDLNRAAEIVAGAVYSDYLERIGGSYDALVIGSGINYFDWKENLPHFCKDLKEGGVVFLYTGIFNDNPSIPLQQTLDPNRPRSTEEIVDFFASSGYVIEESIVYASLSGQQRIILRARKV